jgi:benzoate membrane transport protein
VHSPDQSVSSKPPPAGALLGAVGAAVSAVVIGFGGTIAIVVEAGHALGASPAEITSWVTGICLGVAVTTLFLSLATKIPVMTAWSTPGAALIISSAAGMSFPVAVLAFVLAGLLAMVIGLLPPLERAIARLPQPIAGAMLAGVLLPFGLALFTNATADPIAVGSLLVVYIVARLFAPLAALLLVLAAAAVLLALRGDFPAVAWTMPNLVFVVPQWDLWPALGLAVPLCIATMVAQNLAGLAVIQAAGFPPPARAAISVTGLATALLAPTGVHGINLAAITAALCTGEDAYPDPKRRYIVAYFYAAGYALLALAAGPLVAVFAGVPRPVLSAVAGLALMGPLGGALAGSLQAPVRYREAVLVTMLATASGVSPLGIAAPFWGLLIGLLLFGLTKWRDGHRRAAEERP